MSGSKLQQEIAKKETDLEKTVAKVMKKPELLSEVFEGLDSDKARIKYGCVKVLRLISEKKPEILYPRMDFFSDLLGSDNNFLKWGAIHTIANLAAADSERRFEVIFDKYFAPIPGPELISAGNVIRGAAKIALAKPELSDRIAKEILKVEKAKYQTAECHNVAMGHAIKSFDLFFDQIKDKEPVIKLIKKGLKNTRNATRKKAENFLRKWGD